MSHNTVQTPPTNSSPAAPTQPSRLQGAKTLWKRILPKSYLILVLVVIIIIGYYVSGDFLTIRNAENVIAAASIVAVLAIGQFFVILTGGIDLSVGSILAMSTVIVALTLQTGMSAGLSVAFTLFCCALAGLINGLLVVGLRIPPFIATLAMLSAVKGFSYIIQSTSLIQITDQAFIETFATGTFLGVRNPVAIFLIVTIVAALIAKFTTFGRSLYAIGGNPEAARLSGLPVARNLIITYTMSGFLAGLAGLIAAAQLRQGSSLIGVGYELDAIAAVVVGGASLMGGKGDPISSVIGVFVLATIINIMNLVGISSEPQLVIKGAVIVIAVFLSSAGGVERISGFFSKRFGRARPVTT
ncbi:monosaccharide ABC transporter membrane protein, CUT2 family (TC 3.A.1.2.-) [Microbacterium sp. cf046]|uniref:ABC transporter permease n=1 Tax=Microbacterium sp. cf046 TaxID=1761803 RepID=UPI0008F307DF|nr:ABC transporter permease [Microbacterium sp. cf046]SFS17529.1 monosaccharide ABC transporter membrane protein, CUT2 family (TC 3.A.1.2.-) [Microbacterium sp. cf046]